MRILFLITFAFLSISDLSGQISYSGFIDKYPIELVTDIYADDARAIYCYKKYNDPVIINGKFKNNTLTLREETSDSTILVFENFNSRQDTVRGTWKNLKTKQEFKIILYKNFEIEEGEGFEWKNKEIIQSVSLKNQYFKLLISKNKDDYYARVTGIKILDKKTNTLIQQIEMDCQLRGLENVFLGDFNFDGFQDFAVFESSYAGPNTSSLYFLYNPLNKHFFKSNFSGVSLEFDGKSKIISEHNVCCAGSIQTTALYKVVNNKMVLIEQHCYIWDEKKQDVVEHKMKDCQ